MGSRSVSTKMFKRLGEGVTTDQVVKQIRELIESGELRPGDRLPSERTLADRLGISRPSVRTGLRILFLILLGYRLQASSLAERAGISFTMNTASCRPSDSPVQ